MSGSTSVKRSFLAAAAAAMSGSAAMIIAGCATQEPPKPAAAPAAPAAPAPAPIAAPAPAPAPVAKPEPKKPEIVNLASTELFEFNKAVLTPDARTRLDGEVIAKLKDVGELRYLNVNGHADRLGSVLYNQKLSEKRADAVRAYLVSKGADASKIETFGFGKTTPVKSCPDGKDRKALIECLAPNRRVVVEIQGTPR
jgi:OOP family OmpA-OmpF porin